MLVFIPLYILTFVSLYEHMLSELSEEGEE